MMKKKGLIWGPGVYDGISAALANRFDFPILYMTGAGTAASLGLPDLGLATQTEMVDNARKIQALIDKPLIADADTGYGDIINVIRTVHLYEQAGVGGIHIEDQEFPKRCGHLEGKVLIDSKRFAKKIEAATEERWNPDFVIIARTDARAVVSLEEALYRIEIAFDAGADVGFLESPLSEEELKTIIKRTKGKPMLYNMATGGKSPSLTVKEIENLGFKFTIWPGATMIPASLAIINVLKDLKNKGTDKEQIGKTTLEDFFNFVGLKEWLSKDSKYKIKEKRE